MSVNVFNKELSAGDVTTIYNAGAPSDLAAFSGNLLNWFWMGDGDNATIAGGYIDHGSLNYNGTAANMTGANIVADVP